MTANIFLPPNLSVSIPKPMRPREPTITGTASSSESMTGVSVSSLASFEPSGLSSDQAQKFIINASVAILRAKYAP